MVTKESEYTPVYILKTDRDRLYQIPHDDDARMADIVNWVLNQLEVRGKI